MAPAGRAVPPVGRPGGLSGCCGSPTFGCGPESEHGEASEVVGCGEEVEVGVDLGLPDHAGSASAVFSVHQMPEFAFHFWPGAAVVLTPRRVLLRGAGIG